MTILKRAISLPAVLITGLLTVSPPAAPISQAETDYGEISMYLADTLQKRHYSRRKFDDEVSAQLLESYLRFLDFDHQYFTQEDIARFDRLYKESLDDQILLGDISAAHDIYKTFDKRVRDRIVFIRKLIETEKFTFASDRKIDASPPGRKMPKLRTSSGATSSKASSSRRNSASQSPKTRKKKPSLTERKKSFSKKSQMGETSK